MRAKTISEKFVEKSDPISDMGIGFDKKFYTDPRIAAKDIKDKLPRILGTPDIPDDIVYPIEYRDSRGQRLSFNKKYYHTIVDYFENYVYSREAVKKGKEKIAHIKMRNEAFRILASLLLMHGYPKGVNEKFIEKSDVIDDMEIGIAHLVKREHEILQNMNVSEASSYLFSNSIYYRAVFVVKQIMEHMIRYNVYSGQELYKIISQAKVDFGIPKIGMGVVMQCLREKLHLDVPRIYNESMNEKFSEQGDPVADMGIGIYGVLQQEYDKIIRMDNSERAGYLFNDESSGGAGTAVKSLLFLIIRDKLLDKRNVLNLEETLDDVKRKFGLSKFGVKIIVKYFKNKFDIEIPDFFKPVYEKFEEKSDPIEDIGIGMPRKGDILFCKDDVPLSGGNFAKIVDINVRDAFLADKGIWIIMKIDYLENYMVMKVQGVTDLQHAKIFLETGTHGDYYEWYPFNLTLSYEQFEQYFEIIK